MSNSYKISKIHPIHPFPARMAPSIVWNNLPNNGKPMRILDPMAGSGTSIVIAKARGHQAYGCDTDPLAVLIAKGWCKNVSSENLLKSAKSVLKNAKKIANQLSMDEGYPFNIDLETRKFIDFWFDTDSRIQLTALSICISRVEDKDDKNLLWIAFSRLIITKKMGASLAMDVSHSRPHRKYEKAPIVPFDKFLDAVRYVIRKAPFKAGDGQSTSTLIIKGDARFLPFSNNSMDLVITSPPYLNAIDYLRGHKLALVWMGYSVNSLRNIRSDNIGVERMKSKTVNNEISNILEQMGDVDRLERRYRGIIERYLNDMSTVLSECRRVLKDSGKAIFVIGNSAIHKVHIKNSIALISLAERIGFKLDSKTSRPLAKSRRYLPPPNSKKSGNKLRNRMKEEVILQFVVK